MIPIVYRRAALLAGAGVLLLPAAAARQAPERFQLSGERVAVYNLAGTATIEAGTGAAVVVQVTRHGADAARLDIQQGPIDGVQTLRVHYPEDRIVYHPPEGHFSGRSDLRVRDDGTFGDGHGRSGSRVVVRSSGSGMEAYADLRISVPRGQRIAVYLGVGSFEASNVNGDLRLDGGSTGVRTRGTAGMLSVDVGSGGVHIADHQGDTNVDTGSGSVEVTGMRGDALSIDTGSGSVRVSGTTARELNVDTGSGSVGGTGVAVETLEVDTGSGAVDLGFTSVPHEINIDTGSGSVTLSMPEGLDAEVDLEANSGEITVDFPMQMRHWSRDEVRGVIGNGSGRIRVETGSGGITLRKA